MILAGIPILFVLVFHENALDENFNHSTPGLLEEHTSGKPGSLKNVFLYR
jgi:hypothetical protein